MQDTSGANQRRFPRVDLDLPVQVICKGGRFEGHMRNLSMGGCLLEGPIQARVGEILIVACKIPAVNGEFRAKILWAVPKEETANFGSCFWGADERAKRELIHSIIRLAKPENPQAVRLLIG